MQDRTLVGSYLERAGIAFRRDFDLAKISSIGIGPRVITCIFPSDEASLVEVVTELVRSRIKYRIIGELNNLVISPDIEDYVVVSLKQLQQVRLLSENRVYADAGVKLKDLAKFIGEKTERSVLSRLAGIPGSVGGAVVMNAGAYGIEIGEIVESINVLSIQDGKVTHRYLGVLDAGFGYRESMFQRGGFVVLGIVVDIDSISKSLNGDDSCNWERIRRTDQRYNFKSVGSILKTKNIYREFRGLRGLVIKMLDSILWRIVPEEIERAHKIRARLLTLLTIVLFLRWDFAGYCGFNVNIIKRTPSGSGSMRIDFEQFLNRIKRLERACREPLGREVIVWEE